MPGEALIKFFEASADASRAPLPRADGVLVERRSEPRKPTNWIAMIHTADKVEIPCTVKDVSKSGARLALSETASLPENFLLRVLGYTFLFQVRLVWRSGHCAGVRIERFDKGPPPVTEPDAPRAEVAPVAGQTWLGRRLGRYSSR